MNIDENSIIIPMLYQSIPLERVRGEIRYTRWSGKLARASHLDYADISEEEQQRQRDWAERFNAVMEEGDANDWIHRDYDQDPQPFDIQSRKSTVVYDESEEDHVARVFPYIELLRKAV